MSCELLIHQCIFKLTKLALCAVLAYATFVIVVCNAFTGSHGAGAYPTCNMAQWKGHLSIAGLTQRDNRSHLDQHSFKHFPLFNMRN